MDTKWICCQLGAREHYAVPRALHRQGALDLLLTDLWICPNNSLGSLTSRLRERFHPELAAAKVYAPNLGSIALEARCKLASLRSWPVHGSYWQERIARNTSFQKAVTARLSRIDDADLSRTVMAYSYMALQIFRFAQARGWRTVLGQIDAGPPEERILERLHEAYPMYGRRPEGAPRRYWADWREECALADRIVVNSLWSQAALEAEGVPAAKIRVVPLAYDEPKPFGAFRRFYPASFTPSRPLRVLFLGQINLRKGIASLLDAIRLLQAEPVEFWLVGPIQVSIPADLRNHLRVRWIGPVSRAETARFYREADVFLFPTFSDGFGMTQLEAQAWNLPVIATKFCGDVVKDGNNGWLLSENSADAIAETLRRCLADPMILQEVSSRSVLTEQFGLPWIGQQWLHVFD
jgi:glycosyltransferase involved in cell wall biosynthesis